jgi:actin-related protein 10
MYKRHSTATDIQMRVMPPPSQQAGTGQGTLIIPGWIRERSAEVLFDGGDVDESSLAELILDTLLKVLLFFFKAI